MPRERYGYRENLQDILDYFNGKRLLSTGDVRAYTGIQDNRTLKKRFPFNGGYIGAVTLALCLAGGDGR